MEVMGVSPAAFQLRQVKLSLLNLKHFHIADF